MHLTLHSHATAQRPAHAAFLRGSDPAAWLRELSRWNRPAHELACYLVPQSIRSVQVAGLFVVATSPVPADVLEPYGPEADGRLYVPVQATLWPATAPGELAAALLWPRQLLHPSIGLVGFDTHDELDLATLLDCGAPHPTSWARARPGIAPKPRLQQVRVLALPVAAVVESFQEGVGTVPLAQLPGLADDQPGPVQAALDNLRRRLLKMVLAVVRWLPNLPLGRAMGILSIGLVVVMAIVLLFSVFSQLGRGSLSGLIVPLTILAARLLQSFKNKPASPPTRRPATPAESGSGVAQRLERWLNGRITNLEQKRQNEIERLLRLFGENLEEALKYAIPLGGPYQDRGTAPQSARLGPRATNFNLGGLGGGGRVDTWNLDAYRHNLGLQYRAAATQEIEAGRFKKAAYIYAHLLGDYQAAANTLDQGGFCREAAALYKEHLHNLPAAAKCLEHGGLFLEAAEIYTELKEHENAGDLYQRLDQPAVAARHYERGVSLFLDNQDHPAAARLLADKLAAAGRAQEVLLQGWASSKQPEVCLRQYFDVLAAAPEADLSTQVQRVFQQHTSASQRGPLLQVLVTVNEKHPAPALLATSRNIAYDVVSTAATAGNLAYLPLLRHFLPDDRLIAADCSRFTAARPRSVGSGSLAGQPVIPQLDATIQWKSAVTHGHQWVAIGWRDDRLHLARGNWYGNVEYYSWMTNVKGVQMLLIADEHHSNRILIRTSEALALEIKQLPKNKYFPVALTVECPSWLPAWPARVALLPGEATATASLGGSFISINRYSAQGEAQPPFIVMHEKLDPEDRDESYTWPCELLYRAGIYYSYWGNQLVKLPENSQSITAYEISGESIHLLASSPYSAKLRLAVATDKGLLLWEPTSSDNKPGQVFPDDLTHTDMQFVGPEYLVTVQNLAVLHLYEAVLHYCTTEVIQPIRTIKASSNIVAILPTNNRQQFALLEATGRITLHHITED